MKLKSFTIILAFVLISTAARAQEPKAGEGYFGQEINEKGAVSVARLPKKMGENDSLSVKVKGTIVEVCQAKGCWMTLDLGDNQTMRVKFKDYGFFVPKDAAGKTAVIEGIAQKETVSIDDQKHLAEDAGKTEEEINMITQASEELTFVASGVIIK